MEPDDKPKSELILYTDDSGVARVQVRVEDETVWLTQRQMAELFQVSVPTINEHLTGIYDDEEVAPGPTIRKFRIVQTEGERSVSRLVDHYALSAIIAVGMRVRSPEGTRFRQWATSLVEGFLIKGFALDDQRLKNPPVRGADSDRSGVRRGHREHQAALEGADAEASREAAEEGQSLTLAAAGWGHP